MAFIVLFSTLSFTVEKHYCGNILVDLSVFTEAANCGMEVSEDTSKETTVTRMNCCKDLEITVQGQDNLQNSSTVDVLPSLDFNYVFPNDACSLSINIWEYHKQNTFKEYSPPLLTREILLLEQHFLI